MGGIVIKGKSAKSKKVSTQLTASSKAITIFLHFKRDNALNKQSPPRPSDTSATTSCRITLCNGVIIDITDACITDLLNAASLLCSGLATH